MLAIVGDFAKGDDLSAQRSTPAYFIRQLLLHFRYLGLNSGNRCGLQAWEIFNLWAFSKQTTQISKDLEDSYVFKNTSLHFCMSSRYYGVLQILLAMSFMAAWSSDKVLFTTDRSFTALPERTGTVLLGSGTEP